MAPKSVLETVLYAKDLDAIEAFYARVLGLKPFGKVPGRHVFYRLDSQMLLIFNPDATQVPPPADALPVPPHGATGECHVCFAATAEEITTWKARLLAEGVSIESDFEWPNGGRSIYFRDPAGNCIEFAEAKIWGITP